MSKKTGFLDLAGELRNNFYTEVLSSIFSQSASPPWQTIQSPRAYFALLLTSRQVYAEVQSLFDKEYAKSLTISCESIVDLVRYHDESGFQPALKHAKFIVRDIRLGGTSPKSDHWMVQLLKTQPGFKLWWLERNKLYDAKPVYRRMFEEREFEFTEVEDSTGRFGDVGVCFGYSKLLYPQLKNGAKITAFAWITQADGEYLYQSRSMVLEGKLKDLVIEDAVRDCVQISRG